MHRSLSPNTWKIHALQMSSALCYFICSWAIGEYLKSMQGLICQLKNNLRTRRCQLCILSIQTCIGKVVNVFATAGCWYNVARCSVDTCRMNTWLQGKKGEKTVFGSFLQKKGRIWDLFYLKDWWCSLTLGIIILYFLWLQYYFKMLGQYR